MILPTNRPGSRREQETAATGEGTTDTGFSDLQVSLTGAGASFPAPLYQRWFSDINQEYPGVEISYQSVGSGAGVEQYLNRTVDFGATDAPLTDEEKQAFRDRYGAEPIQVPTVGGAVVFAYNLPEVEQELRLSREAYCGIVSGEITQWDAPEIQEANPDVQLPSQPITFVHRSDGSGTTFLFTSHIAEACPNWQAGAAKTVDWPTGVGARGNEGIAAQVQQTQGAIGFVEYAYANENNISAATLENQAGNYIEPSPEAASRLFEGQDIPEDFALTVPDPSGEEAYPIAGLTFLLLYPEYDDPNKARALQALVNYGLDQGTEAAQELGYVPLPSDLAQRVAETVQQELVAANQ
ncbi:MAG: phosphate ABC transporter substrate-binding protein PstS [Chloroflexaceae bacterium]|nr:phosphate ABC transporter substrate-binding protein PstS [Chloroflexaceae bacterium]